MTRRLEREKICVPDLRSRKMSNLQNLQKSADTSDSSWRSADWWGRRYWSLNTSRTSVDPRSAWSLWCRPVQSCPSRWDQKRPRTAFATSRTDCVTRNQLDSFVSQREMDECFTWQIVSKRCRHPHRYDLEGEWNRPASPNQRSTITAGSDL